MAIIGMLALTIIVVLVASYAVSILWGLIFAASLPSYLSGLVGGLTALPAWEALKRLRRRKDTEPTEKATEE